MKKLMFGLAIAAVGTAFAVESSNVVGYNNAVNTEDPWLFIGASFQTVGEGNMITLNSLTSPDGIEEGDQIQMSYTDEFGLTQLKVYEYWAGDGWADYDMQEPVGDDVGFSLGIGAWFCSASPKTICTSGEVKKGSHIHTFTDPWTICSSAFPTAFCPNSEDVSWGCSEGAQIQTAFTDERGLTQLKVYEYWAGDGWADYDLQDVIGSDVAVAEAGKGFWFIIGDTSETFTEVSPITE